MGVNQVGSVTDTVTDGSKPVTGGFMVEIGALNAAISELQTAGMLNKAQKAEQVVLVMREVVFSVVLEVVALRAELERIKTHGFGG